MRSLVNKLLIFSILLGYSNTGMAECDFSVGIKKQEDGYLYSNECNRRVGKLVLDAKDREEQVGKLNETIRLKDLAVGEQEKRANLWMETSLKLEDRVNTIDSMESTNKWLYFGLGIIVFGASVWGASQLTRR